MASTAGAQAQVTFDRESRIPGDLRRPWRTPAVIVGDMDEAETGGAGSVDGGPAPSTS